MPESTPSSPTTPGSTARQRRSDPLEGLRGRVERAAREIERLRTENAELAARVRALAEDESLQGGETVEPPTIRPPDDPAALRSTIEGFIQALDRVLAERAASGADPGSRET